MTAATSSENPVRPFAAPYAPPDEDLAASWLRQGDDRAADARIDAMATRLVMAIRAKTGGLGGIEDFLHAYSLSTREGLALMVLAEALLRVPDADTANRLIEDKLSAADWSHPDSGADTLLVSASAWTLGITARLIEPGETPETILQSLAKRIGLPAIRTAARQAMRLLGSHFVLGQTIEEALDRAGSHSEARFSYDMLGEGARTAADAERYFSAYANAIEAIGARAGRSALPDRPGISVKLSALHPRYEAVSRDRVMAELVPKVSQLARQAKGFDLNFTVDAEEADRLELSLDVIAAVLPDPALRDWNGFGLAVQAYQKRAPEVIDWLIETATALDRNLMVRLVKGAYWDTEIKRAQERGLADYPVFTRKAMTDFCYMDCARRLLAARPRIFPQFATHNALTVASVIEAAGGVSGLEFQRLHGMGEALYAALRLEIPQAACRIYAPVGGHRDLLAYLVRRLLGERRQHLVRVGRRRSGCSGVRDPQTSARDHRRCRGRAASENSAAARSLCAAAKELSRHRIRPSREPAAPDRRDPRRDAEGARPRPRSSTAARYAVKHARFCLRSTKARSAKSRRPMQRSPRARSPPPRPAFRPGRACRSRSARRFSTRRRIGWTRAAARCSPCCRPKAARRSTTR